MFIGSRRRASASTATRARQVAARLGAAVNPWFVRASDTVVMVKRIDWRAVNAAREVYCDVNDDARDLEALSTRPDIRVIALTPLAAEWIRRRIRNPVICIPIHHCNLEGLRRTPAPVWRVVISGDRFQLDRTVVRQRLEAAGFELTEVRGQEPREKHCAALANADIALAFTPQAPTPNHPLELKPPLKLVNAMAFGVPVVAYPEPAFEPFRGMFQAVTSLDELVEACVALRSNEAAHDTLAIRGLDAAREFSLDRIADAYRRLVPS